MGLKTNNNCIKYNLCVTVCVPQSSVINIDSAYPYSCVESGTNPETNGHYTPDQFCAWHVKVKHHFTEISLQACCKNNYAMYLKDVYL